MEALRKNQIMRVRIDAYSADGAGVCHVDGLAVFVPGTIVGEDWEIRILKVQKNCAYARGERLLLPSPARVDPLCPCFGKCGGCDTRHMSYAEELRFKLQKVNDALERIVHLCEFKAQLFVIGHVPTVTAAALAVAGAAGVNAGRGGEQQPFAARVGVGLQDLQNADLPFLADDRPGDKYRASIHMTDAGGVRAVGVNGDAYDLIFS
jgi:predicted RNA-binding protein with TRAM domain